MRIAYICQSYPPMISGASIVAQRLAEGICKRGHEVLVISASDRGSHYMSSHVGICVIRLRSFPNPIRVNQRFVLWSRREVSKELKDFRPDILHLHEPFSLGLGAALASRLMNKRPAVVLTIHQLPWIITSYLPALLDLHQLVESLIWTYSRWFCQFLDATITSSDTIADITCEQLRHRSIVITNGVDLTTFSNKLQSLDEAQALCAKYRLDPGLPIILYVGRIDTDKRVDLVVRAAAKTICSVEAQLLIVGDGRQLPEVIRLSELLGIRQFCRFPGYVTATGDLPGLYRLSRVFVTASEIEIQSSVVLEAAATGLPIVVVESSSMPEFIANGVNGFLVRPRDTDAMAECITLLLKNGDLSRRMGQANLELARRHSSDHSLNMHEQFYQSLIRNS